MSLNRLKFEGKKEELFVCESLLLSGLQQLTPGLRCGESTRIPEFKHLVSFQILNCVHINGTVRKSQHQQGGGVFWD
jgi:hypothetical protein